VFRYLKTGLVYDWAEDGDVPGVEDVLGTGDMPGLGNMPGATAEDMPAFPLTLHVL